MKRLILACGILAAAATVVRADDDILVIASNPQGSQYYSTSAALAKAIDDKLKRQVRVQPMGGSSTYVPVLNRNEVNFGLVNVNDARIAFNGEDTFAGKPNPNLRLLAIIFALPETILVPANSPVKKIADLKGLRMPSGYAAQSTGRVLQDAVLATAGLSTADMKPVPVVNLFAGVDALAAGRVDAATINPGVGQVQKAHAELSSRGGVRFVSIENDAESIKRMQAIMPSRPVLIQPQTHLVGVTAPTWMMGFDAYLVTNDKTSDALAYDVVKMLHGSRDDLIRITPLLELFDPARMAAEIGVPYHPGARKFYGEIGNWPPKG